MTDVAYDPTTWRDPRDETEVAGLSPMLRQYYDLKRESDGCLLLMRVGDFYEAYGEDAVAASGLLEIVLTKKDAGSVGKIPMAGVPFFALDNYLRGLVAKGRRVAIGDQVEDPKLAKGVVKRAVTRIVTSGTILDPVMLDERRNNYIMALVRQPDSVGVAVADITTGEFTCTEITDATRVIDEVQRRRPAELLVDGDLADVREMAELDQITLGETQAPADAEAERILRDHFGVQSLRGFGVIDMPAALRAAATLLRYVQDTQKTASVALGALSTYATDDVMIIDQTTRRNLELVETLMGRERRGSLLWALDACVTSMGARLMRAWIERPLITPERIEARHDAVEELVERLDVTDALRGVLARVLDLPRLLSRAVYGTANGRDLLALTQSLARLPELATCARELRAARLRTLLDELDFLETLTSRLERAVSPECPVSVREGNLINPGFSDELDELREIRTSGRRRIHEMEEALRERTGIRSLKIGFNNVFGYYIEVTRANLSAVPADFVRKQTIANGERFVNEELKSYEEKILGADERIKNLEHAIFTELVREVADRQDVIRGNAERLAEIDVLTGLAHVAARHGFIRPQMTLDNVVAVQGGRHPVVERNLKTPFVPNDVYVDGADERLLIITGPNMAGKSTYLRQVALVSIMAQMGSFVPAQSARLGIVDRVFTRVGASDDLHLGQSTFLMEMTETANILNNATARSLVVLDEIGRGTSTFDGLSIAWAVAEHLHSAIGCKTLFATHFHELTSLERRLGGCRAYRVAVKENRDEVVFLHRILAGRSDRSYGIYVARLAGLPACVLDRAREVANELESSQRLQRKGAGQEARQLSLFEAAAPATDPPAAQGPPPAWEAVIEDIRGTKLLELTPLAALNLIHDWQRRLNDPSS